MMTSPSKRMKPLLQRIILCCAMLLIFSSSAAAGIIWSAPTTKVVTGCQPPDDQPTDQHDGIRQVEADSWNLTRSTPADGPELSNAILSVAWLTDPASGKRVSPVEHQSPPAPIPIELLKVPIVNATF